MNPSEAFKAAKAHWCLNDTADGEASTSTGAGSAETCAENSNTVSLHVGNEMSRMATAMERIAEAMPILVSALQAIQLANANAVPPAATEASTTNHDAGTQATGQAAAKAVSEGDKIVGDPVVDSDDDVDASTRCGVCRAACNKVMLALSCGHYPYCMTCVKTLTKSSGTVTYLFECPYCKKFVKDTQILHLQ